MDKTATELFAEFLELTDFALIKNEDGSFSLRDLQGANLGNIESDCFDNGGEILERMGIYINDYLLEDEEWGSYDSCEDALQQYPDHPCKGFLELIAYHSDEINLNEVPLMA